MAAGSLREHLALADGTKMPDGRASTGVTGIVLAGGGSRRMGTDKRAILLDGLPMLVRAIDNLRPIVDDIVVVTRPNNPLPIAASDRVGVRIVHDRHDGGPLVGLEAGLAASAGPMSLVVPVDMPLMASATLAMLIMAARRRPDAQGAITSLDGDVVPMPVVVARSVLPTLSVGIELGRRRLRDFLESLDLEVLELGSATHGMEYANLNRPEDLASIE